MSKPPTGQDDADRVEQYGSAGEKQIARMLVRYNIPFEYEKPVVVRDKGYVRLWYPDFYLPEVDVHIEYSGDCVGMEDRRFWKKHVYIQEGISCLWLTSNDLHGYWPKRVLEDVAKLVKTRNAQHTAAAQHLEQLVETRESVLYASGEDRQ